MITSVPAAVQKTTKIFRDEADRAMCEEVLEILISKRLEAQTFPPNTVKDPTLALMFSHLFNIQHFHETSEPKLAVHYLRTLAQNATILADILEVGWQFERGTWDGETKS